MNTVQEKQWFDLTEEITPLTFERIARATENLDNLPLQVKNAAFHAFCFFLNSHYLANQANRKGMHANALSITRQCIEAISIIELSLSKNSEAHDLLKKWEQSDASAGVLRKWLEENAWPFYGTGIWSETWSEYMGKLAKAVQPYAHYSSQLAQWQTRLHKLKKTNQEEWHAILEIGPNKYDPQKATRITLYHALLVFTLARVWLATTDQTDKGFSQLVEKLRVALGNSAYLDGDKTNWEQQFWAIMFFGEDPLPSEPRPSPARGDTRA